MAAKLKNFLPPEIENIDKRLKSLRKELQELESLRSELSKDLVGTTDQEIDFAAKADDRIASIPLESQTDEFTELTKEDMEELPSDTREFLRKSQYVPMTDQDMEEPERAEPEMAETPAESKPRRKSPPLAESEPAPEEEPEAAPPKAVPVAPEDDEMLSTLFKTATGTPFDPKSSRDADYMKKIRETLAEQGGLKGMTPTQFALKLYRKYD